MNFPAKCGLQSLMIFLGSPKHLNMCCKYNPATSSADITLLQGIKIAAFEQSWLVIISIESYPPEGGNLTMKSIATISKGNTPGVGRIGCKAAWV